MFCGDFEVSQSSLLSLVGVVTNICQEAKTEEVELYDDDENAIEVLLKHLYDFDYCWKKSYSHIRPKRASCLWGAPVPTADASLTTEQWFWSSSDPSLVEKQELSSSQDFVNAAIVFAAADKYGVLELKEIMWQGMEKIGSMRSFVLAVEDLGAAVKILWPMVSWDVARLWPMIVKVSVCMLGPFYMSKNPQPTGIEEKVNILKMLGDLDVGIDVEQSSEDMDVLARHIRLQEEIESEDERFGRRAWRG